MTAELQASRRDATLILTLSNPGAKNALHPDMYAAAVETLSTAERDDSIRAVILPGADNFFCSGGNLHGWIEAIGDCPNPVIAAVVGGAAGAGFSLALACDLIVAASSAKFSMSFVWVGLFLVCGGFWFLALLLFWLL